MVAAISVLSFIFTLCYVLFLLYFTSGWARLKRLPVQNRQFKTAVSILIAARDEEDNIAKTIDDLLKQTYPSALTEIIIVDDHSTDRTADIVRSYGDRGVKLLQMQESELLNSYKKKAIAKAIDLAGGELIVCTDADCRMGSNWLADIVDYYEQSDKVMISSPVSYFQESSFFEHLQTLEFSFLIGIGAASIGHKKATTCNGANLAYRKDIFYAVGGFQGIDDVASGDDELLLQKVAEKYPGKIGFLKSRNAIVYTHAKHTLQSFLNQRRRWASKSTKYKDKRVVALAVLIWLFNVTLLINTVGAFFTPVFTRIALTQFLFKLVFEVAFLLPVLGFFRRVRLISLAFILSPVHVLYLVYVGVAGNTGKYQWKGRMVR
ncbi:MAG: glycosyltransferase [Mucilaginibacter polytrichastri]|nr:glycosyltransferase [Mucilaginibacter polytrichastri]